MNPESTCSPKGPWSWKSYSKHAWPWPNHLREPPLEADNWCHTWSPLGTNPRIGWCAWFWWWQRLHSHPLAPHLLRWNWKYEVTFLGMLKTWPEIKGSSWPPTIRDRSLGHDLNHLKDYIFGAGKRWPLILHVFNPSPNDFLGSHPKGHPTVNWQAKCPLQTTLFGG